MVGFAERRFDLDRRGEGLAATPRTDVTALRRTRSCSGDLDFDLLGFRLLALGDAHGEHAVPEFCGDFRRIAVVWHGERAHESAIGTLDAVVFRLRVLLVFLEFPF